MVDHKEQLVSTLSYAHRYNARGRHFSNKHTSREIPISDLHRPSKTSNSISLGEGRSFVVADAEEYYQVESRISHD